jgi:hypothetical protein
MHGARVRNSILSCGWSEPLPGGEPTLLRLLHLDLGVELIHTHGIVLDSSSAHIPDWINSTAAWNFGQSAGWALRGRHFR